MAEGTARATPWFVTIVMRSALPNEPRFLVKPLIVADAPLKGWVPKFERRPFEGPSITHSTDVRRAFFEVCVVWNEAFVVLLVARHDQAEDRLHRIGQEDSVTAWYLLAPHRIDESMAAVLERKRTLIDAVTAGQVRDEERLVDVVVRELRERPLRRAAEAGIRPERTADSARRTRARRRPGWGRRPG